MLAELKTSIESKLKAEPFIRRIGLVEQFLGNIVESNGPDVYLGEVCDIHSKKSFNKVKAEVVGFKNGRVQLIPFGNIRGIQVGSEVVATNQMLKIPVGMDLLGKIIDPFGNSLSRDTILNCTEYLSLHCESENPLIRPKITNKIQTGLKIIDSMLPVGMGQKVGIFAGSGVGKSTLLGMFAKNVSCDVNVIALIGERGREVLEFVDDILGEEGLKKSVLVVAKSDDSALARAHAAFTATTIAEYFAGTLGKSVLLMMDSLTRYAMAQREIGLAVGEPPTSRGYTPSVFTNLPKLIERAGTFESGGSITGIYTVLVEGDDLNDPISDYARATLDGHYVLSRKLSNNAIYPSIDLLSSKSRLIGNLHNSNELEIVSRILSIYSKYEEYKDMISIGAYKPGSNKELDETIRKYHLLVSFFKQNNEAESISVDVFNELKNIVDSYV